MKKLIIATLLTAVWAAPAFAEDYISIGGKKVTMADSKASLSKKFGKPKKEVNGDTWHQGGATIVVAGYDQFGLKDVSVYAEKTNHAPILMGSNGYTITLGKDSIANAVTKLQSGCFNVNIGMYGPGENALSFYSRIGAEGEYYAVVEGSGQAETVRGLKPAKVDSLRMTYEEPIDTSDCVGQ